MTELGDDRQTKARMEPRIRVSDGERDRVVHQLQQAFADGRLTPGEMEERLERALTARSHGDLLPVVADLPDGPDDSDDSDGSDGSDDVLRLASTGGRIRRSGDWQVPRLLRVESEYGGVRLDLSQALVRHPRIDIELRLTYGSAAIVLPPGATANVDEVRTEWGGVTCAVPGRARPGRLHVQIAGEFGYGRLRVRTSRGWPGTRL
ncbi:DUF1707 SHOCT-like domain-containing protein [Streptosporangium sp. G11]|uniref:DUF1707 SHOCT-like domain-containing protein n=1 Tax=Streptosporangium sp. G11 TaxID=3436926 RepID=UPI003EBDA71F